MTTLPSMVLETAVSESVAELIELGKRIWVRGGGGLPYVKTA